MIMILYAGDRKKNKIQKKKKKGGGKREKEVVEIERERLELGWENVLYQNHQIT